MNICSKKISSAKALAAIRTTTRATPPMKLQDPMKTVRALVDMRDITWPDIASQVHFRKKDELRKDEAALRQNGTAPEQGNILTSCPNCLQGLSRYGDGLKTGLFEAGYIVVEMAKKILGADWMPSSVSGAHAGGIERVSA